MKRAFLCVLSWWVCLASSVAGPLFAAGTGMPGEELRYSVFLGNLEKPAGLVTYRVDPEGEGLLTLVVSDRGRGAKISTQIRLDEAGLPVRIHVTGQDYWTNPIEERFEIVQGKASWKNNAEQGEKTLTGPAFYYTLTGSQQELGLLAIALLRAPGHRLAMLPEGETSLEAVGTTRLTLGEKSVDLTLYALSGLDLTPLYVWMDGPAFFGRWDGFVTAIREGWESTAPAMIQAQVEAVAQREAAAAARLSRRPKGIWAVRGSRLFDAETGAVHGGQTVVVSGNRIQAVGPDGKVAVPAGAEIVDAAGKMLLPGLWDMHQHLVSGDGLLDLASGVTSARDLGNDIDALARLKSLWDSGKDLGPRIVAGGVIDGPGLYASPTKVRVDTEEKAVAAVDEYARRGYEQIKIYSSLDPKLVPPIVARAHKQGLRVSGHIPFGMNAEQAVREGFDELQHAVFLFLNFMPGVDTRTTARFLEVKEHAGELDLSSAPVRAFLRLLKEKKTVVDPTLGIYEEMFTTAPGALPPSLAVVAGRLPYAVRRSRLSLNPVVPEEQSRRYRASYEALVAMVRALHKEGIPIVAGTDSSGGFMLSRELEAYVAAGLPPAEVLQIATLGAARVTRHDKDLGTVAPGKLADFILVDGDPVASIGEIRKVVLTVKDGVVMKTADLWKALGIQPVEGPGK